MCAVVESEAMQSGGVVNGSTSSAKKMESSTDNERKGKRGGWKQYLAAFTVNLASLSCGAAMGWSAPAVPVLRGETAGEQPLRLSLEESSWVGALIPMGALLGSLPAGMLADRIGRKIALLAYAAPAIAGWLLIIFAADSVWCLYAGRFLTGVGVGAYVVLVSMYCEEIAEVRVRGILGSYLDLLFGFGMLLVYTTGALLPYFWFTTASLIPMLAFVVCFCWMPESPAYLAAHRHSEKARRSLLWLRGSSADVSAELESLRFSAASAPSRNILATLCTRPKFDRATSKALIIVFGLMFFSQAAGGTGIVYYAEDVFRDARTGLSSEICMIIVGVVAIVGTVLSLSLVDRVGRRFILILSSILLGLSMLGLSVYSYFNVKGYDISAWSWIPLLCVVVFMLNLAFGYGPIKYFMMAELMPAEAKGWGSSVCVCFSRIFSLILAKEFPIMIASLGQDVTYAIFCVFCFLGTLFVVLFVPETKGKTREQIQQELRGTKRNNEMQQKSEC